MDDCDLRSCSPDDVARLCIQGYRSLGAAGAKPRIRPDARHEWTVLAGVVLSTDEKCGQASRQCVVLATGVKAQPTTRLSVHGDVLHDCHAEILVRRALRSWLLSRLLRETAESADRTSLIDGLPPIFVRQAASDTMAPYCFAEGVELHLYCSTLPCGDVSSLNLLRQRARYGETNPFLSSEKQDDSAYSPVEHGVLRGRAFSSASGVFLRTKPGRPQAEPSISMSCTDKIASWSVFGFQGSLLYRWLGRLSFDSYVIGDEALRAAHSLATDMQWRGEDSQRFIDHCRRTLSEKCRHSPISPKLPTIKLAQVSFPDSREKVQERVLLGNPMARVSGPSDELDLVPSAASLIWTRGDRKPQSIVEGRRQGAPPRRAVGDVLRPASRSPLCKLDWYRSICSASEELMARLQSSNQCANVIIKTYFEAKEESDEPLVQQYRTLKRTLRGNDEMSDERRVLLEEMQVMSFLQTHQAEAKAEGEIRTHQFSIESQSSAPFHRWLVSGRRWENFDIDGHTLA